MLVLGCLILDLRGTGKETLLLGEGKQEER